MRYYLSTALAFASATAAHAAETDDAEKARPDIVVTAQRTDSYAATDTGALGIALPLKEVPATINVITSTFLRDTGARKIADIIAYTPGIVNSETSGSTAEYFLIRGFASSSVYFNGIRQTYNNARRGLATIERIEITKGPAGPEAGIADPGGTVNVITKKPLDRFAASIDAGIGDFHYRNLTADVTGPIALDGKLSARLVGGYQRAVVWRPGLNKNQPFYTISPSLKLDYAENGSIYVEYEHDYVNEYFDRGVIHLEGFYENGFGPRNSSQVTSELNETRNRNDRVDVGLDQKLGPFTATAHFQNFQQRQPQQSMDAEPQSGDIYAADGITWNGTGFTVPFAYARYPDYTTTSRSFLGQLSADATLAGIRSTFVGGYQNSRNTYGGNGVFPGVSNVLDIRAPDNAQTPVFTGPEDSAYQFGIERIGSIYGKWVGRFGDRFRIFAGVRRDKVNSRSLYSYVPDGGVADVSSDQLGDRLLSYRAAASCDVTRQVTAFVGYSNAFIPQGGVSRSGPIPALRARSIEAGVKIGLADGRALWTNTLYSTRQDNQTIGDPTNQAFENFLVLFGAVRVRGFESELTGRALPGLDLSAGLSVLQSRILKANDGTEGNRFLNVPAFQASAFGNYDLAAVGGPPLRLRGGFIALGNRQGDTLNSFRLPGYLRVDAGLTYAVTTRIDAGVTIENLFDKTYYVAADQGGLGGGTVSVGNRRLVQATLGFRI